MTEAQAQFKQDLITQTRLAEERFSQLEHLQADFDDYRKREGEERARLAVIEEFSEDAILSKTLDGIITSWNTSAERIYGYSAQDIVGKNISLLVPPGQTDDTKVILEQIRNGEPVVRYETLRRKKDGRLIDITLTASPIRDTQTHLIGVSTIAHDITLRKTAEDAMHASETRYRRLFETAQDGILILDAETGQIVEVNPFLITMLGFSRDQFLGKKLWEIGLFKDIVANKDNFEELQRKEYIRYEDMPLETADGQRIAVEFISNVYTVNNKKVIQCNIRDSTERKLAEEAQIASEIRYRRLFETAQDGILILDAETGQIVEVNPFLITMLGFSRDQFLGKKLWEIGLFKDIVANKDNFEELQRKEYIRYEDMPLETADGQRIAVEFVSSVYEVNNKKVIQCNIRNNTERKLAEEAQVASEIRYRRLFETAQDGILILDAETGQIVEVNPYSTTMLGFSREEFLGKKIWDIGVFKDIVANKDNFEELQRKEYIRYEDLPLETADGRNIAVEFVSNVYMVNNKKVIQCNIRDITDRKKIEVALNATETRYRRLFETAQDGILILDAETGQIVEVNPYSTTMLGFSREEFLGKKIWDIGVFKDIVANKDNFEELQRKEYIRYEDLPLETADGRNIAVEFVSNVYMVNNKKVIQCNIRDITDRKKIEVALNATETRYRRLFETAQDGILILDAETGQIVEVNPFLITMLGFSRDQFLGKKLWEIGLFKDIVANKDNFEELQRKEYVRYEDMPIETADGQRIAVEFVSSVYEVNNKKVIQCNIRNITVRKKLEEDLVVKAAELARSNIELQQFAYVASHDLQEPLRAISGFTELLVTRYHGKIDEKADKYLDFITEGTTRMQQMIQDLLSYSRVQTLVHEFVLVDSTTALDLALSDLQVATREHHAVITHDPLPSVFADREQITKMFQNIIGNAIKFHKPDVVPKVHVSAKQDENTWIFSIADNGIGIDPQYADRIFKIFQRLHTRDEYPGTGIGLAICKRIAEQHGGTIWIESVPGSGSTFNFTIPKRKEEITHE